MILVLFLLMALITGRFFGPILASVIFGIPLDQAMNGDEAVAWTFFFIALCICVAALASAFKHMANKVKCILDHVRRMRKQ